MAWLLGSLLACSVGDQVTKPMGIFLEPSTLLKENNKIVQKSREIRSSIYHLRQVNFYYKGLWTGQLKT
jgi:hypothetical protein